MSSVYRAAVVGLGCLVSSGALAAPSGSYSQSCGNVAVGKYLMTATCQRADGSWIETYLLRPDACVGDISNQDGTLRCTYGSVRVPAGSYSQTCNVSSISLTDMVAACQRRDGSWMESSLSYYACSSDISNQDGTLTCH